MSSPAIHPPRAAAGRRTDRQGSDPESRDRVRSLLRGLPTGFVVFDDLRLPQPSSTTVDHLVVGPRNLWSVSTHVVADPVTFGQGRNDDTLWSGRTPLRAVLESADWEASTVSQLIGLEVEPLVCLVAPSLPEPMFDFHGIRVSSPEALARQITTSTHEYVDVPRTSEVVERVFATRPGAGTAAPKLGSPTLPPTFRAVRTTRPRRTIGARLHAARSSTIFRVAVALALLAALLAFLPSITGLWDSVAAEGADRLTEIIDDGADGPGGPAPGSAGEVPTGQPTRHVRTRLVCPASGAGWMVHWGWPGSLPDGVAAYTVRTQVDDAPAVTRTVLPWSDPASPPPPARLSRSGTTTVLTDHRAADGTVLATTSRTVSPPADPC